MKYSVMIALLLTGCVTRHSVHVPVCPAIIPYSAQSQSKLADELENLPANSEIMRYILDYKRERDMLAACQKLGTASQSKD